MTSHLLYKNADLRIFHVRATKAILQIGLQFSRAHPSGLEGTEQSERDGPVVRNANGAIQVWRFKNRYFEQVFGADLIISTEGTCPQSFALRSELGNSLVVILGSSFVE